MRLTLILLTALIAVCARAGPAPRTDDVLNELLYIEVVSAHYDNALTITVQLEEMQKGEVIRQVVARLIKNEKKNIMEYAYKLWTNDWQNIVENYFPVQFKLILNEHYVALTNKMSALNYGLLQNKNNTEIFAFHWKWIPLWENNKLYFKVVNVECGNAYLGLLENNNHRIQGVLTAATNNATQLQWYLQPITYEKDLLFFIFNRKTNEAMAFIDSNGDGKVEAHGSPIVGSPDYYAWFVSPTVVEVESMSCLTNYVINQTDIF